MLQNNFWYKTSTIGKLFNFIDTVFKKLFLPIRNNLPFFYSVFSAYYTYYLQVVHCGFVIL